MADNSNQGFLNSLFQWTVRSTAEEAAAAAAANPTTTSDAQPMNEEVCRYIIKIIYYLFIF
jgi:hypothetical protein